MQASEGFERRYQNGDLLETMESGLEFSYQSTSPGRGTIKISFEMRLVIMVLSKKAKTDRCRPRGESFMLIHSKWEFD